jgi:ABC-type transporter Mla MlaB component
MSSPDKPAALFSKVAQFVRNPMVNADPIEASESLLEADAGKQALRKMLQRKRHNDTIRQREFDALRKILKSGAISEKVASEQASIFREATAYTDFDERAQTLKKIDDIEAQMSKQWWKVRAENGSQHAPLDISSSMAPLQTVPGWALDAQDGFPATLILDQAQDANLGLELDGIDDLQDFDGSAQSAFSDSKMVSVERGQTLSDPVLADVVVRFAQGDDAGTERLLLTALRGRESTSEAAEPWAGALFDFYRTLQKKAEFEKFASEHTARFGRVAPRWEDLSPIATEGLDSRHLHDALSTRPMEVSTQLQVSTLPSYAQHGSAENSRQLTNLRCVLAGELLGDCDALLHSFLDQHAGHGPLVVSCAHLLRVDFAATGCILNWAAGAKSSGIEVELRKVSRLVAAFFMMIGINEYALIRARSD